MSFLAQVLAYLLQWVITRVGTALAALIQRDTHRTEVQKSAEESVKPLKDAVTGEAIDKAADDALNGL